MFGFPELLLAATMAQTPAQTGQVSPYQIDVSLVLYRGEQISARAGSGSSSNIEGYVWMDGSGCLTGAASGSTAPPSMPAGMRWHYTAVVTRQTGSEVTVDASWQRVGEPAGDAQHREVTVHPGETITLEAIQVPASNSCGITAARLSLSMGLQVFGGGRGARGGLAGGGSGAGAGMGGRGGAGGIGAGAGAGGRGAGGGTGGGGGVAAVAGGRGGGRGMGGASAAAAGGRGTNVAANPTLLAQAFGSINRDENTSAPLFEIPGVSYDAELWLVHTGPGLTGEATQLLPIRVSSSTNVATFSPVSVQTPQGPATVEVAAVVRVLATTDSRQVLRVAIARSVRGAVDNLGSIGNTSKVIPSPAVGDVVSFEIPEGVIRPARSGGGGGRGGAAVAVGAGSVSVAGTTSSDMLGGHQFSVRLRLKSKGI